MDHVIDSSSSSFPANFASALVDTVIPEVPTLSFGASFEWMDTALAGRIDFSKKPVLAKLLARLVRARLEAPGVYVSRAVLVAHVWEGERLARPIADNRLAVSIASLRKFGLRGLIEASGGGLRIRPDVHIEVATAQSGLGGAIQNDEIALSA